MCGIYGNLWGKDIHNCDFISVPSPETENHRVFYYFRMSGERHVSTVA